MEEFWFRSTKERLLVGGWGAFLATLLSLTGGAVVAFSLDFEWYGPRWQAPLTLLYLLAFGGAFMCLMDRWYNLPALKDVRLTIKLSRIRIHYRDLPKSRRPAA
ncbi:MAG: hypothetical protein EXS55_00745 [Candidatus Magasanikbacteria bacterium]|nr:hypothetical protein [Candidatus Magasanikbacteria bacterium]